MKLGIVRSGRFRPLALASAALLLSIVGLAAVTTTTAQADVDGTGRLSGGIYNQTPGPLTLQLAYSHGKADPQIPSTIPANGSAPWGIFGSATVSAPFCANSYKIDYNSWFTYKARTPGQPDEFITISIHGARSWAPWGCLSTLMPAGEGYPALDVWNTSSIPPSTWRWDQGAPPNVLAKPQYTYAHNVPALFDQTITTAEGPGRGTPAIVSLGDSTISGEGGRWAGNTNVVPPAGQPGRDDAGAHSYWDTPTGESIQDCHRSTSAEVHIGAGFTSQNFACSGATTYTYDGQYPQGWRFKPGVDWHCDIDVAAPNVCMSSRSGQLTSLYGYALTHNVKNVVVAVGANDFDFSGVVKRCIMDYLEWHLYPVNFTGCQDDAIFQTAISAATKDKIQQDIWDSLKYLTNTMAAAGYNKDQYNVILQNYWSAIPPNDENRYPDIGFDRQVEGGCPVRQLDDDALNNLLMPAINDTVRQAAIRFRYEPYWPKIRLLDLSHALDGHRLCEQGVGHIEDIGPDAKGMDRTAADRLEWVTEARVDVTGTPYTTAEGGHANYWGQLAERNCLRQLVTNRTQNSASCRPDPHGGVNNNGEPNMTLTPFTW